MKHDEIKGVVICGYPGIGKSTAAANRTDICDAESSAFSHPFDPVTGKQKKSNEFPRNYVDFVSKLITDHGGYRYVLCSCHKEVREELNNRGIPYIVVVPHFNCKDEYMERYLKRGDSVDYIQKMYDCWDEWHDEIDNSGAAVIHLWEGQNLSDILPK